MLFCKTASNLRDCIISVDTASGTCYAKYKQCHQVLETKALERVSLGLKEFGKWKESDGKKFDITYILYNYTPSSLCNMTTVTAYQ
jgi:hypothetical protein